MSENLVFPIASAERIRHCFMVMLRGSLNLADDYEAEAFLKEGLKPPSADGMSRLMEAASEDDAEEWTRLIRMLDAQTGGPSNG